MILLQSPADRAARSYTRLTEAGLIEEEDFFRALDRAGERQSNMTADNRPPAEMSAEEFVARIRTPRGEEELQDALALIAWFMRRYPTPKSRLAYVKRKYREWTRYQGTHPRSDEGSTR